MTWRLRLHGVGNASAVELGSAMATLERDGEPWLTVDCGGEGLTAFLAHYGRMPEALFVTHNHLDHIGGFERLFVDHYFDEARRGKVRLYVPAPIVPLLHQRVADYPNVLAEGGVNFWEAFRLVPCHRGFWLDGLWFDVFPTRHHLPQTSFGLALGGSFAYTGDTRPVPEMLARYAAGTELIAHDCGLVGNPSHTGIDDIEREYPDALRQRLRLYHYGSADDGAALAARGYVTASTGERIALPSPTPPRPDAG